MAASYGTKYRMEWTSRNANYRLDLEQVDYSDGVTQLQPGPTPIQVEWGTQGNANLPIGTKVSTAKIKLLGDSDGEQVLEMFDTPDNEWRVEFQRDVGSGWSLVWRGFVSEIGEDNPHGETEYIEIDALDGLALLEDIDLDFTGGSVYAAARGILHALTGLDLSVSMEWYPYRDGDQLSGNEQPMDKLQLGSLAFDEVEALDDGSFESEGLRNQRAALEAILKRFGLELFQEDGEWWMRQAHRVQPDGSVKKWAGQSAVQNDNPTTADVSTETPFRRHTERPRDRAERSRTVESVQTYDDLGQLIGNPSFEQNLDGWSTLNPDNLDTSLYGAETPKYDDTNLPTESTQNDARFLRIVPSGDNNEEQISVFQTADAVVSDPGPLGSYRFEMDLASPNLPFLQLYVEGDENTFYVEHGTTGLRDKALPADSDGKVFVEEVSGSEGQIVAPVGSKLPIVDTTDTDPVRHGHIILEEPFRVGETEMIGEVTEEVPKSASVTYWYWSSSESDIGSPSWSLTNDTIGEDSLVSQQFDIPARTLNGTAVVGPPGVLVKPVNGFDGIGLDHVSAKILIDGDAIEETFFIATVDQSGREESVEQLIGDGPTDDHPRAFQLSDVEITNNWKIGPYSSGESPSGQLLEELTAVTLLRHSRNTRERRTYEGRIFEGEELWPSSSITVDGKQFLVSYLRRSWGADGDTFRVELTEQKDGGTADIEQAFSMESDTSTGGTGGSGGTTIVSDQTIEGASSWSDLTGKPDELVAKNGDSDGIPETITLPDGILSINGDTDGWSQTQKLDESTLKNVFGFTPLDPAGDTQDLKMGANLIQFNGPDTSGSTGPSIQGGRESGTGQTYLELLNEDHNFAGSELRAHTLRTDNLQIQEDTGQGSAIEQLAQKQAQIKNDVLEIGFPGVSTGADAGIRINDEYIVLNTDNNNEPDFWALKSGEDGTKYRLPHPNKELSVQNTWTFTTKPVFDNEIQIGSATITGQNDTSLLEVTGTNKVKLNQDLETTGGLKAQDDATLQGSLTVNNGADIGGNISGSDLNVNAITGDSLVSPSFSSGFSGNGFQVDSDGHAEFESLSVRSTLEAKEFEQNKVRFSSGLRLDTAGGGKISNVKAIFNEDNIGTYGWRLEFEEDPGIKPGDYVLVQETSPNSSGDGFNITRQVRMWVDTIHTATDISFFAQNSDFGGITADEYLYSLPQEGDDAIVVGNSGDTPSHQSVIEYNPYGPTIKLFQNISQFSVWESRGNSRTGQFGRVNGKSQVQAQVVKAEDSINTEGDASIGLLAQFEVDGDTEHAHINRLKSLATRKDMKISLRDGDDATGSEVREQIEFNRAGFNTYGHWIATRHDPDGNRNAIDFFVNDGTENAVFSNGNYEHTLTLEQGNVGIGTQNPDKALDVQGDARINAQNVSDGDTYFQIDGHRNLSIVRRGSQASGADISIESTAENPIAFGDGTRNGVLKIEFGSNPGIRFRNGGDDFERNIGAFTQTNALAKFTQTSTTPGQQKFNLPAAVQLKKMTSGSTRGIAIEMGNSNKSFYINAYEEAWEVRLNSEAVGMQLDQNGNLDVNGSVNEFQYSDETLKENASEVDALDLFDGLCLHKYDWKDSAPKDGTDCGLMAQDIEERMPWAANEIDGTKRYDRLKLIPAAAAAIAELKSRVEELETKLASQ